ncbi:MAG: glutathione S-transferase family protein, partial [Deltaproteobacteria bacterium]
GLENVNEIQAAAEVIRRELKIIDERLAQSNWLVDAEISAADIAIFPAVQLLLRAAGKEAARPLELGLIPLAKTFPNIARWINRIEELPNYQRTYPPHWR